jgi:hypothetical protein
METSKPPKVVQKAFEFFYHGRSGEMDDQYGNITEGRF